MIFSVCHVPGSIFIGSADYFDPGDQTFLFYQEDCGDLKLDSDYNLAYQVKNVSCGENGTYTASGGHDQCRDPGLSGPLAGLEFGLQPGPGSPALQAGDGSLCPEVDILPCSLRIAGPFL